MIPPIVKSDDTGEFSPPLFPRKRKRASTRLARAQVCEQRRDYLRACNKRKRAEMPNRRDAIVELADKLGGEIALAVLILRKAREDADNLCAGKTVRAYEWGADRHNPAYALRNFFCSEWFTALASGLGQEPDYIRARMLRRLPQASPAPSD